MAVSSPPPASPHRMVGPGRSVGLRCHRAAAKAWPTGARRNLVIAVLIWAGACALTADHTRVLALGACPSHYQTGTGPKGVQLYRKRPLM